MPVSLLDIAPPDIAVEEIEIRGKKLTIRGLTNREYAVLLKRFPTMAKQVAGATRRLVLLGKPSLTAGEEAELARITVSPEEALFSGIDMAPAIIAAGLGQAGKAEIEAAVDVNLSNDEQTAVLNAVMRLTTPAPAEDAGPLAEGAASAGAEPETTTQSP